MIFKGFRFGMLLQFAIGPMCIMVFNTATTYGFLNGLFLVLAITLVDGLYITLSGLGVAIIINKEKVKRVFKWLGFIVLLLFGLNTIVQGISSTIIPDISFNADTTNQSVFMQGLLLTASNPLTIIFWSGVFSAQVAENHLSKKQLILFSFGCILSTIIFLTAVALCGSLLKGFLPSILIQGLNILVGVILIVLGFRLLLKK